jgi:light-regulated signal transduction histidine kinase (bacteriophytochrome)
MAADNGKVQSTETAADGEERAFERDEKEKRAAELVLANIELAYQNEQKSLRAQELIIANKELAFQNDQKEQRAQELIIANKELAYQNLQKEQRAQELLIANRELAFQNEEKELRAIELAAAIKDLEAFAHVSSHHLQEPLRKIRSFVDRVLEREAQQLTTKGQYDMTRIDTAAAHMSQLIQDIHTYSRIGAVEAPFKEVPLADLVRDVVTDMQAALNEKGATVEIDLGITVSVIPAQVRQALQQLIDNALKFSTPGVVPHIHISGGVVMGDELSIPALTPESYYCYIEVSDNGIGFNPHYSDRIFEIFQKLHTVEEYGGTGIGLAIVKKIMDRHKGWVVATGEIGKGAKFGLYFPYAA